MFRMKKFTKKILVVSFACLLSVGLAFGQQAFGADVEMYPAGISFSPGPLGNVVAMNVRIVGPSGTVMDDQSTGETIMWSPAGMSDGDYAYEAVVITSDSEGDSDSPGSKGDVTRTTGGFEVQNGQIIVPEKTSGDENLSFLPEIRKSLVRLAMAVTDLLVPSAEAVDLTASSTSPSLWFDDTQDEDCTPAYDWRIEGQGGVNNGDGNNFMRFIGVGESATGNCASDVTIAEFRHNGSSSLTSSSRDSLLVSANGDMRLANSTVFIDRSEGYVGIGTVAPTWDIQINSPFPQIKLLDESTNSYTQIQMDSPWFTVEGNVEQDIFNIHESAPADSLNIQSNGNVGIGTGAPFAALTVQRNGGAVAYVDDNGFFTKRQMFVLENNGAPSFRFINSGTGRTWTFAMTDNPPFDEFVINDPFSPGREMFLDQGGNAQFEGVVRATNFIVVSDRNLKGNIEPVDGGEVLRKVMELPISTWNFKDDSEKQLRIGPMGQDFQKIFGLGPDDRHISVVDATGVALSAIQGLGELVKAKDTEIAELKKEIAELRTLVQQVATANQMTMVVK